MTQAEVQELLDDVPCDLCNAPPGLAQYMVLAAMIDVANGDPVPETTQSLISEASCLLCMVPPGLVPYLQIQALRNITGGGGVGQQEVYTGAAPPAAPDDPTKPALFFPTGGGTLFQWDVASQTWV